jgi:hypothetical protein
VPPEGDVLWWMLCQTTQFCCPVVIEVPTLKVSFLLKASVKRERTSTPSLLSGKNAVLYVPEKFTPFLFPLGML